MQHKYRFLPILITFGVGALIGMLFSILAAVVFILGLDGAIQLFARDPERTSARLDPAIIMGFFVFVTAATLSTASLIAYGEMREQLAQFRKSHSICVNCGYNLH